MPTQIIDLDAILGDDKRVKLGGKTYLLPPDLPVELYLKINKFAQTNATETEMVEALYEDVLGLFRYKQPALKALPLTLSQLIVAIGRIYGDGAAGDEPRPPVTRGGRSGRTKTATKSRR